MHGRNAILLLCIPKTGAELKLRTVIDAREKNNNTIIDTTPLPNQDLIREAVASHKYTSVIDMTDAYEQMCITPEDVPKTIFTSPLRTFVSNVLQQGDCNGPSSWQRLMTYVFHDQIGVKMWVYIDNIYIFSNTISKHKEVLQYVLECLTKEHLYISPKKFNPYAIRFNCLSHFCDKFGLHASADKLELICKWPRRPTTMKFNASWDLSSTFLNSYQMCWCSQRHYLECAQMNCLSSGATSMIDALSQSKRS